MESSKQEKREEQQIVKAVFMSLGVKDKIYIYIYNFVLGDFGLWLWPADG